MFQIDQPYTPMLETYASNEITFCVDTLIREADLLSMKGVVLNKLTEAGDLYYNKIITEDATQIRSKIAATIRRLIEIITNLTKKFQHIAATLVARNANWLKTAKSKINQDNIPANFSHEIFPYHTASQKLLNYKIPEFQEGNQEFIASLENADSFKEKYFKDLFVNVASTTEFDPKVAFRGGFEKIKMTRSALVQNIGGILSFIEGYSANAEKIVNQNKKLIERLKAAESKAKTAPMTESHNFILETITMLLEVDEKGGNPSKPVTSQTIDKEQDDTGSPSKPADKKENVKDVTASVKLYTTVCYGVNSARMGIMEESYNAYVKLVSAAITSTRKKEA